MPTRIEIELTSASPDGSWTWRAAGAREPRGVLDGAILPADASVGDQLRVETEQDLDGIRVLSVLPPKEKAGRMDVLELLPSEERFEPVIQQRAPGGRDQDRGPRRPRRERGDRPGGDRPDRTDRPERRRGDAPSGGRPPRDDRDRRGPRNDRPGRDERRDRGDRTGELRRSRPHFTPPPEVPQRPKPKRLRPGKVHRTEVLDSIAEEQRPVAELALQGLQAVRQRLREDNARLRAEGKPEMPEAAVMKMAEDLLPRLRVADWLDRADAAKRQLDHLDLRDLRSVVAASEDPLVVRDESTRALASDLKAALLTKQEEELNLWLSDVEAALEVGRVVRALRLSSQPPKAGVPFPPALATRLGEATTGALTPSDPPERWIAVLEAAAFSPVRTHVTPATAPEQPGDDLRATVKRLGPLLPQVAAIFGIEVPSGAHVPKPLRPAPRKQPARPASAARPADGKDKRKHREHDDARAPQADGPAATTADVPTDPAPESPVGDAGLTAEATSEASATAPPSEPTGDTRSEPAPAPEPSAAPEPMSADEPDDTSSAPPSAPPESSAPSEPEQATPSEPEQPAPEAPDEPASAEAATDPARAGGEAEPGESDDAG
jgi:hypothetical protein